VHMRPRWRFFNGVPFAAFAVPDSQAKIHFFTSCSSQGNSSVLDWLNKTLPLAPQHRIPLVMNLCLPTGGEGGGCFHSPFLGWLTKGKTEGGGRLGEGIGGSLGGRGG